MPDTPSICIVTPHHLANNPRVIKEAETLAEGGGDVTVIHGCYDSTLAEEDEFIALGSKWKAIPVKWRRLPQSLASQAGLRLARLSMYFRKYPSLRVAARAEHVSIPALSAAARQVKSELYIGHTPSGLCAAAAGARHAGALLGFDAEDYHATETDAVVRNPRRRRGIETIEQRLLPLCASFTASTIQIAEEYAATRGTVLPNVFFNAFPRSMGPLHKPEHSPLDSTPRRLYWFSQTIGPGRGLEKLLVILGKCKIDCDLYIRGNPEEEFLRTLEQIAVLARFRGQMYFLRRQPASEMARLCSGYDLGLALELSHPGNRDICLTNKIFIYLLAGLPIAYTPTRAQSAFCGSLSKLTVRIDLDDPVTSARELEAYFRSPARQERAREDAWLAGQSIYCRDTDEARFISVIENALQTPPCPIPRL